MCVGSGLARLLLASGGERCEKKWRWLYAWKLFFWAIDAIDSVENGHPTALGAMRAIHTTTSNCKSQVQIVGS